MKWTTTGVKGAILTSLWVRICLFYCEGIYTLNVQSLGPGVHLLKVPVTFLARNQTLLKSNCVVPENIHTPRPHGGKRKFGGEQGSKMRQSPREWGWPLEVFFPGTPSKIGELLKTNSCSVEQAVSCFTVTRCFKAETIVFIDDLLFAVGWLVFSRLAR